MWIFLRLSLFLPFSWSLYPFIVFVYQKVISQFWNVKTISTLSVSFFFFYLCLNLGIEFENSEPSIVGGWKELFRGWATRFVERAYVLHNCKLRESLSLFELEDSPNLWKLVSCDACDIPSTFFFTRWVALLPLILFFSLPTFIIKYPTIHLS